MLLSLISSCWMWNSKVCDVYDVSMIICHIELTTFISFWLEHERSPSLEESNDMFNFKNYFVTLIDIVVESSTHDSSCRFTTLVHNDSHHSTSASKTPFVNSSLVSLKKKSLTFSSSRVNFVFYSHLWDLLFVSFDDDSKSSIKTLSLRKSKLSFLSSLRSLAHLFILLMLSIWGMKNKRCMFFVLFYQCVINNPSF